MSESSSSLLVPSQVLRKETKSKKNVVGSHTQEGSSVVERHSGTSTGYTQDTASFEKVWNEIARNGPKVGLTRANRKNTTHTKKKKRQQFARKWPKLFWLSVPEEHLRVHPHFVSLPESWEIKEIKCFRDLSNYRQSSWQWDRLHVGRLTTSLVGAVMGTLEPQAAKRLGVPNSLYGSSKGQRAYHRLLQYPNLKDLKEAKNVLIERRSRSKRNGADSSNRYWKAWGEKGNNSNDIDKDTGKSNIWVREYTDWYGPVRAEQDRQYSSSECNSIRMAWGSIHEPTAVLVAINYFNRKDALVYECGMFPGEAILEEHTKIPHNVESDNDATRITQIELLKLLDRLGCQIGATPDGIIKYPNGRIEVLEVKNHCPFFYQRNQNQNQVMVRDRKPDRKMLECYMPQLQLEMFCVGFNCRSAILIRLTATKGAMVYRIPRSDEYIEIMLQQIFIFFKKYVLPGKPPLENFGNGELLDRLVGVTKHIAATTTILDYVPHHQVQRCKSTETSLLG